MRCFVCDTERNSGNMHPEPIAGKRVCLICFRGLGKAPWESPEEEVRSLMSSDTRGNADPHKGGGRFKRHKG